MMKCRAEISQPEKDLLLTYLNDPARINPESNNIGLLVDIDMDELTYKGDPTSEEANAPMYQTQDESIISSEVEDLSDEMKRARDDENRENMGKTTIAFFDIS